MKRSLVKGRNGGKQRHCCVACMKSDHRLENIRRKTSIGAVPMPPRKVQYKKTHVFRSGPFAPYEKFQNNKKYVYRSGPLCPL